MIEKTSLKIFLSEMSYILKNKIICFRVWSLSLSERFIHFCFDINASQNLKLVFPLFSRDPDGRPISNFYRCVSLCTCDDGLHKVLTLPRTVLAKTNFL